MDITQRFKGLLLTEIASHLLKTHAILTHDVQYIPYRWPYAHLFRMGYLLLWHWLPSGLHLSIFSWFKKITTKAFQVTKERLIFFDIYMPILLVHQQQSYQKISIGMARIGSNGHAFVGLVVMYLFVKQNAITHNEKMRFVDGYFNNIADYYQTLTAEIGHQLNYLSRERQQKIRFPDIRTFNSHYQKQTLNNFYPSSSHQHTLHTLLQTSTDKDMCIQRKNHIYQYIFCIFSCFFSEIHCYSLIDIVKLLDKLSVDIQKIYLYLHR